MLIQKDPIKSNAVGNYRPIAYLNLLWKLLTGIITDKLHEHLENQDLCQKSKNAVSEDHVAQKTNFS